MQVPVQLVLQQKPSTHDPEPHWSPVVQVPPTVYLGVQVPPFTLASQKSPAGHCPSAVHAAQTMLEQTPLRQSVVTKQPPPTAHGAQVPPQSTPVSPSSFMPSEQCSGLQLPSKSHCPPVTPVHPWPRFWGVFTHWLLVQA
jgi:hypothetical protein